MRQHTLYSTIFSILVARMKNTQIVSTEEQLELIVKEAKNIFASEPSLLNIKGDFMVVGDIHGNVDDLLRILGQHGYPSQTNYLFLGDYVDRGQNSLEVIILLYCLKILFPQNIYMIRGNHECETISSFYGFKQECLRKTTPYIYRKIIKSFMHLPFAAIINDKCFCVHGGISPHLTDVNEILTIPKPSISANNDIANDLVWSDPLICSNGFQKSDRGSGYFFNQEKLDLFLDNNNLDLMIRSHESCIDGYDTPLKRCITVFSNTDYCGIGNFGATIAFFGDLTTKTYRFKPLTKSDMKKRRIIIPEWIIYDISQMNKMVEIPELLYDNNAIPLQI
ncbi:Ser/Thr protein phosphatase [Histomonas meleagridis]|uniref:Ser/Thr protein phosphatase n=1 Tax=Histomonas meleagridis TaxID=135588 RepID=UPI0035595FF0|nr:Ser/Thr protein phosphatase [Histomonas meleagridis]KAH0797503.1 Ser/Thr protein phosphatase [Histomonas meleagridis]